jgi:hypothetical protein
MLVSWTRKFVVPNIVFGISKYGKLEAKFGPVNKEVRTGDDDN